MCSAVPPLRGNAIFSRMRVKRKIMNLVNANDRVKVFGGVSILFTALLLAVVHHGQKPIEVTFMDVWEKNKDTDSFKAGLLARKPH